MRIVSAGLVGLCIVLCCSPTPARAAPTVEQTDSAVTIKLDNGVVLTYALRANQFLGLNTATVAGVALKSPHTLVRPVFAQDKGDKPYTMDQIGLREVTVDRDTVHIACDLFETNATDDFARLFVTKDGKPHTDYYLYPHLGLPSEVMKLSSYEARADNVKPGGVRAGTLDIVITPVTQNIGGFTWQGWKHQYVMNLQDGRTVNCIRELSTWETNGQAQGNTVVACRYRGLGGLSETLSPLIPDSSYKPGSAIPVKNAFTTTEILPGAVDKAPVVSPAVPGPENITGREEGMKYRHGAWIAQPQRGAGANFIDFQYRPTIALASYYEKQDCIRSVTEIWPGDAQISYTDCLYFPLTSEHATVPKVHLALVPKAAMPEHEWRTRYQEMDLFVRDLICKDLGFVQHDPLPALGINWDNAWEFRLAGAITNVDAWNAAGIKRVITHHPGWYNGRGLRQKETAFAIPQRMLLDPKKPGEPATLKNDTGGDCSIHDYIPQSDKVRDLWKTFARKLNSNDIEYMVWITGMIYGTGPLLEKFPESRWAKNSPEVDFSSGYPGEPARQTAGHRGITMRDPEIKKWWTERMDMATGDLGVSGFWADSFQNMFMSQMNYQHKDWAPQTREWWEWIAAESRKGIAWMSESHSFPGLSCSIEVGNQNEGYSGEEWIMLYSTRWYRGKPVPFKGTEKADQIFFRTMANKGPIAPGDADPSQIPSLKRMSDEYMAALPRMNRPYQLPEGKGVLWLPFDDDKTGVLFAFSDGELPVAVEGALITAKTTQGHIKVEKHRTYTVSGTDLISSFGLARGDQKDPRLGTKYVPPIRYMKDWRQEPQQ